MDENGHVQWVGLGIYADAKDCQEYLKIFGKEITNYEDVVKVTEQKERFETALARLGNPPYGSALFKQAYLESK